MPSGVLSTDNYEQELLPCNYSSLADRGGKDVQEVALYK